MIAADRSGESTTLEATATGLVILPFTIASAAMILLAAGVQPGAWPLIPAAIASAAAVALISKEPRQRVTAAAGIIVTLGLSWAVSSWLFDGSYDGLWYHQEAVLRLTGGWNPVRDSIVLPSDDSVLVWLQHYPKAAWLTAASVLSAFDRIEPAKLFGLALMVAAFCQTTAALRRLTALSRAWTITIGALAAANPVALYQAGSYYVDGQLASCLTIATASAALAATQSRWAPRTAGAAALCVAINLKYTGLLYALVVLAAWVAAVVIRRGLSQGARDGVAAAGLVVFATFVLGYASYGRNVLEHGNPFVPVADATGIRPDMMQNNLPADLVDANRVSRFLRSTFAQSDGTYPPSSTRGKTPFRIYPAELSAFEHYDVRIGGLGPLFGGLILLAAVAVVAGLAMRSTSTITMSLWILGGIALASVFLHPEGWWARYAPQAWLTPIAIAAGALAARHRVIKSLGAVIVALALINAALVGGSSLYYQLRYASSVRDSLQAMREAGDDVHVSLGRFQSLRRRLHEAGVRYQEPTAAPPPESARHPIPAIDRRMAYWYE